MDVALISILSGSTVAVSGGGEESSQEAPLDAKPFGAMMASVAQESLSGSENAQVGQRIDQVPAMLLHGDNTPVLLGDTNPQPLVVTSSDIAALAVGTVDAKEISHSAQAMLAPLDIEPVEWSVEEPMVIEVVQAGVAVEVDANTGVVVAQADALLNDLPADNVLPNVMRNSEADEAVELLDEEIDALIGDAQSDLIEVTDIEAGEVITPLSAPQEGAIPVKPTNGTVSVSTNGTSSVPTAPDMSLTPLSADKPAMPSAQANTAGTPAPQAATDAATQDMDAEVDAVIDRVLNQPNKVPANQNSVATANQSPVFDVTKTVAQPDVLDKLDVTTPQPSAGTHMSSHEGIDRFSSLHVLKAEPSFQGRPTTASEQVQVTIRQAFQSGLDRVVIELDPADLGRVEVRMEVAKEGRVQVMVIADNRDTLDLLRQDSRALERALQDAGLDANAGDMEFQMSSDQDDAYDDEQAQAYSDAVEDARVPDESYIDPLTGHYTVMVNEGLDIKV